MCHLCSPDLQSCVGPILCGGCFSIILSEAALFGLLRESFCQALALALILRIGDGARSMLSQLSSRTKDGAARGVASFASDLGLGS